VPRHVLYLRASPATVLLCCAVLLQVYGEWPQVQAPVVNGVVTLKVLTTATVSVGVPRQLPPTFQDAWDDVLGLYRWVLGCAEGVLDPHCVHLAMA
jgi:hypothetical protein